MKKRLLAFLLVLVMVAGFVPITAQAEGETPSVVAQGACGTSVSWVLTDDGLLKFIGSGAIKDYFPMNRPPVMTMAPWKSYSAQITTIEVGEEITSIGNYCFNSLINVVKVYLPASLTAIRQNNFNGINSLSTIMYAGSDEDWQNVELGTGNELITEEILYTASEIVPEYLRLSELAVVLGPFGLPSLGLSPAFDPAISEYTVCCYDGDIASMENSLGIKAVLADSTLGAITAEYTDTSTGSHQTVSVTSGDFWAASLPNVVPSNSFVGNTVLIKIGDQTAYTIHLIRCASLSICYFYSGGVRLDTAPSSFSLSSWNGITGNLEYNMTLSEDGPITVALTPIVQAATVTVNEQVATTTEEASALIPGFSNGRVVTLTPEWSQDNTFDIEIIVSGEGAQSTTYIVHCNLEASIPELLGSGTADDPWQINEAADYVTLRQKIEAGESYAGQYVMQTADITLADDWQSIGKTDGGHNYVFAGYLDGGGYTLTVPDGGAPLFGNMIAGDIRISNLKISGTHINGAGLINNMLVMGSGTITLENITLLENSSTLGSGLVGGNGRSAHTIHFINCVVEDNVTVGYDGQQSNIGSLIGMLCGTVENCSSSADVYGVNNVGGLVGSRGQSMSEFQVSGSAFHGSVTGTGKNIGGIVGGGYYATSAPNGSGVTILNCTCGGTITGGSNVGGILGADDGVDQYFDNGPLTLRDNTFTGTVSGSSRVGGIAGFIRSMNRNVYVENNTFSGCEGADKEIGFVTHIDTSAVSFGMHDGTFYFNTADYNTYTEDDWAAIYAVVDADWIDTGRTLNSSIIKADQNRFDDPLGVGGDPGQVTVTNLTLGGEYKTEYLVGDELDTTNMTITATMSDGSTQDVDIADVEVSGFDTSTPGEKTVSIIYGGAFVTFNITVTLPSESVKVKLSVLGDDHHQVTGDADLHGLWLGGLETWMAETEFTVENTAEAPATVWKLLNQTFDADASMSFTATWNNSYGSYYIDSVTKDGLTLREKDNVTTESGYLSGWMYAVNGVHVQVGVSKTYLNEGDVIILHWTDDSVKDEAAAGQQQQDQQAAFAVEALIDAIGTPVTLESETAITAARTAYDALTDGAKGYVTNLADLEAAEAALAELQASAQRVADVIAAIDAIGEVTLDSADAINTARTAYNALTDDEKALVTNYATLTAAEAALAELQEQAASAQRVADVIAAINALPAADELTLNDEAAVAAARAAYDALSEAEQAQVTNLAALEAAEAKIDQLEAEQDQQAASAADQVIAALPAVDAITLDDAAAVAEARAAYDALTPEQQALVNNYDVLLAAEAKIAQLQEQAASAQRVAEATAAIDALPAADEVTLADEAAVIAARMAYDALSDAEKAQVSADKLIAAEAKIAELKAQQSSQEKITDATDKISALPAADAVTLADEAAIAAARAAYDALTDAEKAQVDASALVAAEARLAALKFAALKPEVKTANAKNGKIELTITPVAGAVKYKILVSDKADGTYKEAATVTEPKYTYNGTPGTKYFFKVVAVNAAGVESAESAVVSQFRLPAQVTSLKVKSKKKKEVTLTWKKVTGAKKYVIYMSKNGKTGWKKIGTVKTNKFTYKKAPAGKKMYFRVQAVTANGKKGEFSKAVSVKVKK